jgi:hypothetical protein
VHEIERPSLVRTRHRSHRVAADVAPSGIPFIER